MVWLTGGQPSGLEVTSIGTHLQGGLPALDTLNYSFWRPPVHKPLQLLSMRSNLPVRDLAVTLAFYRDVLGFDVAHEDPAAGFALLRGGGAELALLRDEASPPQGAYLYVSDVEEAHSRCTVAGAPIPVPLTTQPWGLRDFVVEDPSRNRIAIGQWIRRRRTGLRFWQTIPIALP